MKEWLLQLYSRWRALHPRERVALAGGGTLALILLGYALLWVPVQRDLSRLRVLVPKEHEQLLVMRAQAQEIARLRARAPVSANAGNLLTTLERSATEHQLRQYITRMEPDPSNGVRVSLDAVAFDALLRWLADLQRDASVRAQNVSITAQAEAGMVNARLLLLAAGT